MSGENRNDQNANGGRPGAAVRQEVTITNQQGLHARPAAEFVRAAKSFRSQVWLVKADERFSADSILELMTANINCGETVVIEADGADAGLAVERLVELTAAFGKEDRGGQSSAVSTEQDS